MNRRTLHRHWKIIYAPIHDCAALPFRFLLLFVT
jgi:hypothetical protein